MDQLDLAVQKTIEYGSHFGVVYDEDEICNRLISGDVYPASKVKNRVTKIKNRGKVTKLSPFLNSKYEMVRSFAKRIEKHFPDILMVAITGSVAAGYCKRTDDIDLMIVTRSNRLWINRLMLRIYVWLVKIPHRKFGEKENPNDFCFNLWIEEGEMKLPRNKQTLRNAMDTILMIPVLNKKKTYEGFLAENSWVAKHVASGYHRLSGTFKKRISIKRFGFDPISLLNWLVFWPQWWYMKGKISTEVVGLKRAFFHPSDRIRYVGEDIC